MARKNLLSGLTDSSDQPEISSYRIGGASKSMIRSVNELARQADAFLEGEQIVEIDPELISGSFIDDRLDTDNIDFFELKSAINEQGQNTPILVRPHPELDGRFMIVFGHRRVKVARELGRKVRAVVKALDDKAHVIAQGQENSARANLTFIEKAIFAKNLEARGFDRDTLQVALSTEKGNISKLLTVTSRIPLSLIKLIGAAPGVGRERWIELSLLVERRSAEIHAALVSDEFTSLSSDERFNCVLLAAKSSNKAVRKSRPSIDLHSWASKDNSVSLSMKRQAKKVAIEVSNPKAVLFSDWLATRLDSLFDEFHQKERNGE